MEVSTNTSEVITGPPPLAPGVAGTPAAPAEALRGLGIAKSVSSS